MSKVMVEVTENDIRLGKNGSNNCPIARSLKRLVNKKVSVNVTGEGYVTFLDDRKKTDEDDWYDDSNLTRLDLPEKANKFIETYDDDGKGKKAVKPLRFQLNVPKELLKTYPQYWGISDNERVGITRKTYVIWDRHCPNWDKGRIAHVLLDEPKEATRFDEMQDFYADFTEAKYLAVPLQKCLAFPEQDLRLQNANKRF